MFSQRRAYNADIDTVGEIMGYVEERVAGLGEKAAYELKLACEEILVNIANYAYPHDGGRVDVIWEDDEQRRVVRVRFEDGGVPFDPLKMDDPPLDVPMEQRTIGGLGVMMVRRLSDSVEYARIDGKNVLTITKGY